MPARKPDPLAPAKARKPKPEAAPAPPPPATPTLAPTEARAEMAAWVLDRLQEANPNPETELHYRNAYELVVAVALSAQCTDVRVNKTTPTLFERYPDAAALAQATFDDVFGLIRSISYPNNKAKHLIALGQRLTEVYNGQVPDDIDELMTLPGVGRKTANVLASVLYNKPYIAVDTHVLRVSNRLGLAQGRNPEIVERHLNEVIPPERRAAAHHWLILHGRYTCIARRPQCSNCVLAERCPSREA